MGAKVDRTSAPLGDLPHGTDLAPSGLHVRHDAARQAEHGPRPMAQRMLLRSYATT